MHGRQYFIVFHLALSVLFISCSNNTPRVEDTVLIKIGDYRVSRSAFESQLNKLLVTQRELNREELATILLDNYISAGLLVEYARNRNYENNDEFIQKYKLYKEQLIIKYSKYIRSKNFKLPSFETNEIDSIFQNKIIIDYIRIPKKQKQLIKLLHGDLIAGANITNILKNPKINKWYSLGLSFYENVSTTSAVLPFEVRKEIAAMHIDEVRLIKTSSASYIVRYLRSIKPPYTYINYPQILMNLQMAQGLEGGDMVFDENYLKTTIDCNEGLLSQINFSISPISDSDSANTNTVAEIYRQFATEADIKEQVSLLPMHIQTLFKNKSTRTKAIATLVLLNYSQVISKQEKLQNEHPNSLFKMLTMANPKDTVEFLHHWMKGELEKNHTNMLSEILLSVNPHKNSNNEGNIIKINENIHTYRQYESNSWLHPFAMPGYNNLKLNFAAIDKMEFKQDEREIDNEVLAYAKNWRISVKDFKQVLNKLTPETRIDIAEKDMTLQLINYLAKQGAGTNIKPNINTRNLKFVDIVGHSFDSINYVIQDNYVVGTLGNVRLTVADLRKVMLSNNPFVSKCTRKNFEEIIANAYWQNMYSEKIINQEPLYNEELLNYKNWLLAETLYKTEIQVVPFKTDIEKLDSKIWEAVKNVSEERLHNFINKASQEYSIQVDSKILQDVFKMNINASKYSQLIKTMH